MSVRDDLRGHGHDRSYKRGAVMGLTVAEAFILLAFCLLLLFTWWQVDTESKSLAVGEQIAGLDAAGRAELVARLQDGSLAAVDVLRAAGIDPTDHAALNKLTELSRLMRDDGVAPERLTDGSLEAADILRSAGIDPTDHAALQELAEFSRFVRDEDLQRLLKGAARLRDDTLLSLTNAVEMIPDVYLRRGLEQIAESGKSSNPVAERIGEAAQAQAKLVDLLNNNLGGSIREAGGSIDSRGAISLPESILFSAGSDVVRNPQFLAQFCGHWLSTLHQSGLALSDLRIEGHASSEGRARQSVEAAYVYNLGLSQRRALSALEICLGGLSEPVLRDWTRPQLAAIGYSSSKLIYRPDGSEDRDASRRVMFSVELDQTRVLDEIRQEIASDRPLMEARGRARVIDGDTLELHGARFRLVGIDAPELGQPCRNREGVEFDCGEVARLGLERMISGQDVACIAQSTDRYRRPLAVCRIGEEDLSAAMVAEGYAVAYEQFSDAYVAIGMQARSGRIGIWNTEFEMPWDYR